MRDNPRLREMLEALGRNDGDNQDLEVFFRLHDAIVSLFERPEIAGDGMACELLNSLARPLKPDSFEFGMDRLLDRIVTLEDRRLRGPSAGLETLPDALPKSRPPRTSRRTVMTL